MTAQRDLVPWKVEQEQRVTYVLTRDTGDYVCEMDVGFGDNGAEAALNDAHMIAAAPELLTALEDALDLIRPFFPQPAAHGVISRCRATLAKARGLA